MEQQKKFHGQHNKVVKLVTAFERRVKKLREEYFKKLEAKQKKLAEKANKEEPEKKEIEREELKKQTTKKKK